MINKIYKLYVLIMAMLSGMVISLRATACKLRAYARTMDNPLILRLAAQSGALTIETIILIFVAITILYQLIPTISGNNATVQASGNVSSMGKFSAGLGEWLFPLLAVVSLCFMLFKRSGGGKAKV